MYVFNRVAPSANCADLPGGPACAQGYIKKKLYASCLGGSGGPSGKIYSLVIQDAGYDLLLNCLSRGLVNTVWP